MFESMFAGVAEDALVGVIEAAAREEAAAGARRLAAIAELVDRCVDEDDERGGWAVDPWDHTAARVAAALTVGHRRASGQMRIAVALRYRLPKVAALFSAGALSARVISELTWRTQLVQDPALITLIDAELADKAVRWGPLSVVVLGRAIDAVIERYDPEAVRRAREVIRTRDFHIGACEDTNEFTVVWGRLSPTDAAALRARITAMVAGVCPDDPRTAGERWADAVGALGHGNTVLDCRCGGEHCPATPAPSSSVVIRVIADQAAVDAARKLIAAQNAEHARTTTTETTPAETEPAEPTPAENARPAEPTPAENAQPAESMPTEEPEATPPEEPEPTPPDDVESECAPSRLTDSGLAVLPGRGVIPTAVLAEALRGGAKVAPLWLPGPDPEPHYRPSARLAEFIRVRDMFCRFPGCDVPADRCDIDHVEPWPLGLTHPSNLNCKCRSHHLMKTFWGGPDGWRDAQLPDATVIWTAPDGRTYTTKPGSRLFFPSYTLATAELPPPACGPPINPARTAMMPRRRRTRAADNAARIKAERALNSRGDF
ncbi:HNH endonuclease signature motif containing protein [Mycolicibacterium hippocampi]|uniref:13E12 repeat family protein n=1 Tax=Mycolicibacterium hippocampi TaxID=659824 RepID=A0A850PPF6_9MYCO|nr:HNH endonuclease signature motif containing protein [Mycolicibacterium hippocampi]NVN50547.1 13E12 repeat family protein [Mycolicibacterium hippocampi]